MELSNKRRKMLDYEFDWESSKTNEYFIHPPLIIKYHYTSSSSTESEPDQDQESHIVQVEKTENIQNSDLEDLVKVLPRPPPAPKLSQILQPQEISIKFQCYIVKMGKYLLSAHQPWQKGLIELKISNQNDFVQIQIDTPEFVDKVTSKIGKKFNLFFNLQSVTKVDIHRDSGNLNGYYHLTFKLTWEEIDIIRKHLKDEEEFSKNAIQELVDFRNFRLSLKNLTQDDFDNLEKIFGKIKIEITGPFK